MPLHQTCMQCAQSKVRCDKNMPCGRCHRRGTPCTTQIRKRGSKVQGESREEAPVNEPNRRQSPSSIIFKIDHQSFKDRVVDGTSGVFFLGIFAEKSFGLTRPVSQAEASHAQVAMQSIIQGISREDSQSLSLAAKVCNKLGGPADLLRQHAVPFQSMVIEDPSILLLPVYINAIMADESLPCALYAYYQGHETFLSNTSWNKDYTSLGQLRVSMGSPSSFLDYVASVISIEDRRDFLAVWADMLLCSLCHTQERSMITRVIGKEQLFVVTMRYWSDSSTQSFILAMRMACVPQSKYISKRLAVPCSLLGNTPRATECKAGNSKCAIDRDLATDEQLVASVLPLDEALELDFLDVEAVAEYLSCAESPTARSKRQPTSKAISYD